MASFHRQGRPTVTGRLVVTLVVTLLIGAVESRDAVGASPDQRAFVSPREAVQALVNAMKVEDMEALAAILGPEGRDLISSGDAVSDKQERAHFVRAYEQSNNLERPTETKAVLVIGRDKWPLPIPVIKEGETWVFDTVAGKEEILNRRIGRNELSAIQVCLAYVDAQREYARVPREGDRLLTYAMNFRSDEDAKNGLYWPTKEGEALSPLGVLIANARAEGYSGKASGGGLPTPYHGYVYRILTAQGPDAPGGAYDYVVNGKMIGGFALVAYPAQYGVSGVMTFIVNHEGVMYQKDLGADTENTARAIEKYNPDKTWKKAGAPPPPAP